MDTTYLTNKYVIKKYERQVDAEEDAKFLELMADGGLRVPRLLEKNGEWYLYTRIGGKSVRSVHDFHIALTAGFLKKYHALKLYSDRSFFHRSKIKSALKRLKKSHFAYVKRLWFLHGLSWDRECSIHGDMFLDNLLLVIVMLLYLIL